MHATAQRAGGGPPDPRMEYWRPTPRSSPTVASPTRRSVGPVREAPELKPPRDFERTVSAPRRSSQRDVDLLRPKLPGRSSYDRSKRTQA